MATSKKENGMSAIIIEASELEKGSCGVLIPDACSFNLSILQAFLGGVKENTAKRWAKDHDVPRLPGRTWLFSGLKLRLAIEAGTDKREKEDESDES